MALNPIKLTLFVIIAVAFGCQPSVASETKCDNSRCTEPVANKLNVHLVPHTHLDVGWLKTVDQLYYGSNNKYQTAGVQYILDSVVNQLIADKQKKFIFVEIAFFWKWWKLQNNVTKEAVKGLVNEGRLEFINGGWSMNDEGTCHYSSIIDQMTWGHRRLTDQFGTCGIPKIGWQIDTFGHSREQANLFAQMNFNGFFFARMDYEDLEKRMREKTMEMVWEGSDDLGPDSDIFTHMMKMDFYGPPKGFNWDLVGGSDDPFIDDPESEDYNVDAIVENFINFSKSYSKMFATNNLLFPMGTDFQYQAAGPWYKNMDKLIKYVNQKHSELNVFYSTPSCYLHGVQQSNHTFPTKSDDFFPYAIDPHSYWTGYFSSRPALKRYEKVGNNLLQICKQIDSLNIFGDKYEKEITSLREWMGVLQHHDGVTGTEKQHVANNYALKLYKSIEKCKSVINEGLQQLMAISERKTNQIFCQNLNISACDVTEGNDLLAVTIYNPIGRAVQHLLRLPVTQMTYEVMDPFGKLIKSDVVPIPDIVLGLKERVSKARHELVFETEIPALGFATYFLKLNKEKINKTIIKKITESFSVKTNTFDIMFAKEGKLIGIQLKSGKVVKVNQEFLFYKGMAGNNTKAELRASGAYIFRPDGQTPQPYDPKEFEAKLVQTSEGLVEVHQKVNSYISQVISVDPNEEYVVFDYVVGPIPVSDSIGKEIIFRYDTDLVTSGAFYTDANGRQIMKRVRNFRPTWNLTATEPDAGNYYPVNSRIAIRDEEQNIQMTVLNDRSQGGSSLRDGSIELMVHRRDLFDDAFGVGEPLNETGFDGKGLVIRGKFWLLISSIEDSAQLHRDLAQRIFMEPLITFAKIDSTDDYLKDHKTQYSGLTRELPKNIHLLTLEQWRDGSYLLRLEHFYQRNESKELSKPVTIDFRDLFQTFEITEAVEMTLTATEEKKYAKRLKFNTNSNKIRFEPQKHDLNTNDLTITLNPMDIKTFVIKVKAR